MLMLFHKKVNFRTALIRSGTQKFVFGYLATLFGIFHLT